VYLEKDQHFKVRNNKENDQKEATRIVDNKFL
jgi:hypothetical protein